MSLIELFQAFLAEYARRVLQAAPAGTAAMLGIQSRSSPAHSIAELDATEVAMPQVANSETPKSALGGSKLQNLALALSAAETAGEIAYLYSLVYPPNVVRQTPKSQAAQLDVAEADDID